MFSLQRNFNMPTEDVTPEVFWQVVRDPHTASLIEGYRRTGDASLKRSLPAFMFQATFDETPSKTGARGRWRKQSATRLTGLVVMDLDNVADPVKLWSGIMAERLNDEVARRIVLVYVTPSGKGLKIVAKADPEAGNLIDNQHQLAKVLGVEVDESCKDASRMSFVCRERDILFIDNDLFTHEDKAFAERYNEAYRLGKSQATRERPPMPLQRENLPMPLNGEGGKLPLYHGVPYSRIVEAWLGGRRVEQGDRHRISLCLADHLRYITDNDARLMESIMREVPFVREIIEERNENVAQTIKSAQGYVMYRSIPRRMQEALAQAGAGTKEEGNATPAEKDAKLPPEMPEKLPPLISLLVSRTPDIYKAAVCHAVFPALGAHLHKTRFRYIDNVLHEATLMNVLMAGTGAGKDCITAPINHIMADIRRRDEENLAREKAWKDEVNRRGANKDKRQRPEGLVIQEIDADMTGPAFVMRMAEADGHFLYTKLNEIDQFDALRGNGRTGQQFQIMCLSFDPDNRYGQTRVGTQSVTEKVTVRFNWNATTTIQKGKRYFERVLTDGPVSRINFCTIPEREIGAPMPVYGTYDAAFDEELRPYIERLCAAHGTIECPQAYKLIGELKDECAEFSRLSQSRTYENLSFRALVIAYLKACLLYVAHGCQWDKSMEDFTRWSLQYDLWCKMQFFGEAIEQATSQSPTFNRRGPRNLLALLPDEFTAEDAIRVRREQGLSSEGTKDMLRTWRNRGYIEATNPMADGEQRTNEQLNSFRFAKLKG